jgi:hypothetical protein
MRARNSANRRNSVISEPSLRLTLRGALWTRRYRKALKKELVKSRGVTVMLPEQSASLRSQGEALIQRADKLLCESWNERMWSVGEPIDPSPTIDQAINGGLPIASQAGKGLFRRQEVQDLVALARVLADGRDTLAFGALMRGPVCTENLNSDIAVMKSAEECK